MIEPPAVFSVLVAHVGCDTGLIIHYHALEKGIILVEEEISTSIQISNALEFKNRECFWVRTFNFFETSPVPHPMRSAFSGLLDKLPPCSTLNSEWFRSDHNHGIQTIRPPPWRRIFL